MSTNRAIAASAPVGKYQLEVGATAASSAQFSSGRSKTEKAQARANAAALRKALATPEKRTPIDGLDEVEASARAVTDRVEHANDLFHAATEGRLLDRDVLTGEIGSLLGLLERLDREGRYEEEIRVAKAVHGLCVVAFRWLDLLRSLRSALSAARAAGDESAQAWALNELGALHLCAGALTGAERYFEQALELQERIGDPAGRCAIRHNLDSARRDIARPVQLGAPRPLVRLLGVKAALAVVLLAVATPSAVAWFATRDSSGGTPTGPPPTRQETGPSGDGGGGGTVSVTLQDPGAYLRGAERLAATTEGHVDAVEFQWATGAGSDWTTFARDGEPPYEARLKTRRLEDGHYLVRAVAGVEASEVVGVVVDNTPPTAKLLDTGTLAGSAELHPSAQDELSGLRKGSPRVQYSEAGSGSWARAVSPFATTGLTDGPYYFQVLATDRAGNTTKSSTTTLWIDNDAPEVRLTAPDRFVNAEDAAGGAYTVAATADARDVASVEFSRCSDDSLACATGEWISLRRDVTRPFQARWTVDDDGNRALKAVAADRSHSIADVIDVVIDRQDPIRGAIAADTANDTQATWVVLTITPADDSGTGLAPGGGVVTRADGTWITNGLKPYCALAGELRTVVGPVPDSPPYALTDTGVEENRCYFYFYEAADLAGNVGRFSPTSVYVPGPPG